MVVYVTTQGAKVTREGRHLLVRQGNETLHTVFPHRTEQLVLAGNITLTQPAVALLTEENIDTVFLRANGRYLGRLVGAEPKNAALRFAQFALSASEPGRLPFARSIVAGKLANMATVLLRIGRARQVSSATRAAGAIRKLTPAIATADSIGSLMGLEGRGSAIYFAAFRYGLIHDLGFRKRVRRPPTDPVNTVLSLLYTLLASRAHTAVHLAGLDPQPGFLHSLHYGRHSLPLDLMEEFRSPLVDTLTLSLFNLGVLREQDFDRLAPAEVHSPAADPESAIEAACDDPLGLMTDEGEEPLPQENADSENDSMAAGRLALRMTPEAYRRVVRAFERKLQGEFLHPATGNRISFSEALLFQARQLREVIEGKQKAYLPLQMR